MQSKNSSSFPLIGFNDIKSLVKQSLTSSGDNKDKPKNNFNVCLISESLFLN
jgi:hypothetical protein